MMGDDWYYKQLQSYFSCKNRTKAPMYTMNGIDIVVDFNDTVTMQGDKYEELLDEIANALDDDEVDGLFPSATWYEDDDEKGEMTGCGWCMKDCSGKDKNNECPEVCDSEDCSCDSKGCGEKKEEERCGQCNKMKDKGESCWWCGQ